MMDSDLKLDASLFAKKSVDPSTVVLNERLRELCARDVNWWQVNTACRYVTLCQS